MAPLMTDTSKATPRPWCLNSRAIEQSEPLKGEKFVSVIAYLEDEQTDEWRANAALIVRAVNAYDAMREALETVASRLEAWADTEHIRAQHKTGTDALSHANASNNYSVLANICRAAIMEPVDEVPHHRC